MDKNAFISLLNRYHSTTDDELSQIISLKNEFPYSQVLRSLAARVTKDHGDNSHQTILQDAAVYAADRAALKEIFSIPFRKFEPETNVVSAPSNDDVVLNVMDSKPVEPVQNVVEISSIPEKQIRSIESIDSIDYADEVMRDLETLNTLKHNFEMLFVEYSEVETKQTAPAIADDVVSEPAVAADSEIISEGKDIAEQKEIAKEEIVESTKDKKSKKARIVEMAKRLSSGEGTEVKKPTGRKKNPSEALIDEIQSSKEELTPESEKQKEQIEMINQFIRTQPSISGTKERQASPIGDLNPIKSGEFGDNIVSETLVDILIKQGKKEKAIEVLKKLIWKYPQKKSYFASQIEDLKK